MQNPRIRSEISMKNLGQINRCTYEKCKQENRIIRYDSLL